MKDPQSETPPPLLRLLNPMAETYSTPSTYPPPGGYYQSQGSVHIVGGPHSRSESQQQRKRPKYTRSKTGCLTCRVKKIKCDETKPICNRCTHGQRDCTWPEGVPTRKKPAPKKECIDGRPSTAESSGISETSTPPTRDSTPPRRPQNEYTLAPLVSRRHSEPFVPPLELDPEARRLPDYPLYPGLSNHHLSMTSEMYQGNQARYHSHYASTEAMHPRVGHQHQPPLQMRAVQQQVPPQHWTLPHLNSSGLQPSSSVAPMNSFFSTPQERNLVGHSSNDHHPRYQ